METTAIPRITQEQFAAIVDVAGPPSPEIIRAYELYKEGIARRDLMIYTEATETLSQLIPEPQSDKGFYYLMDDGGYVGKGNLPGCKCPKHRITVIHLNMTPEWARGR